MTVVAIGAFSVNCVIPVDMVDSVALRKAVQLLIRWLRLVSAGQSQFVLSCSFCHHMTSQINANVCISTILTITTLCKRYYYCLMKKMCSVVLFYV